MGANYVINHTILHKINAACQCLTDQVKYYIPESFILKKMSKYPIFIILIRLTLSMISASVSTEISIAKLPVKPIFSLPGEWVRFINLKLVTVFSDVIIVE